MFALKFSFFIYSQNNFSDIDRFYIDTFIDAKTDCDVKVSFLNWQ